MFIIRSLMLTILFKPDYCPHNCSQIRDNLTIASQQQLLSRKLCTSKLLSMHIPVGYWLWKIRWSQW